MELWDLYDEWGNMLCETWDRAKKDRIPEGKYHIVCDVLIRNVHGEYLLTLRDPHKDIHPGEWEASAGGSALAGETPLQAAEREMFEETGLTATNMELLNETVRPESRAIFYSYLAETECGRDAVRLQAGETVDYRWVDARGLLEYIRSDTALKSHNERYADFFDRIRQEQGDDD